MAHVRHRLTGWVWRGADADKKRGLNFCVCVILERKTKVLETLQVDCEVDHSVEPEQADR